MIEDYLHRLWVVAQLRASTLGPDLDALTDELQGIGYSVATIQNHLHAAGHLAYWLTRQRIQAPDRPASAAQRGNAAFPEPPRSSADAFWRRE